MRCRIWSTDLENVLPGEGAVRIKLKIVDEALARWRDCST
jgi:hypothetical protein